MAAQTTAESSDHVPASPGHMFQREYSCCRLSQTEDADASPTVAAYFLVHEPGNCEAGTCFCLCHMITCALQRPHLNYATPWTMTKDALLQS